MIEETNYPFGEEIHFKITMSAPAQFPLALRTPGWCEKPTITVNGESITPAKAGEFVKVNRTWKTDDQVIVKLPMAIRIHRGVHDSAHISRGPLLCSLQIEDEKRVVGELLKGFKEFENTPEEYVESAA